MRADSLPLALQAFGAEKLPRGSRVRIQLGEIDLLSLHISAVVLAQLEADDGNLSEDDVDDEDSAALELGVLQEDLQPDAVLEAQAQQVSESA